MTKTWKLPYTIVAWGLQTSAQFTLGLVSSGSAVGLIEIRAVVSEKSVKLAPSEKYDCAFCELPQLLYQTTMSEYLPISVTRDFVHLQVLHYIAGPTSLESQGKSHNGSLEKTSKTESKFCFTDIDYSLVSLFPKNHLFFHIPAIGWAVRLGLTWKVHLWHCKIIIFETNKNLKLLIKDQQSSPIKFSWFFETARLYYMLFVLIQFEW